MLVGHYLPAFKAGGPPRSIANLVGHLGGELEFRIMTSDRDLGDVSPFPTIAADSWTPVGSALVRYVSPTGQDFRALARTIQETPHDLLYLNGFFSPRWTVQPLVARRAGLIPRRPTVVAPRGEFSAGALALKAPKKRAYLGLGKAVGLFPELKWQASSSFEADDIRAALGIPAEHIRIAMDLAAPLPPSPPPHAPRSHAAPLQVASVSRISPMKNLDYSLRVLGQVTQPVDFSIYGPPEDASYHRTCQNLADELPPHVRVSWHGAIEPSRVPEVIARHDLFFLPTRGENYGHVIAEALGAGTPVLISDATPWRGLSEAGVGHDLPLHDPCAFAAAIDAAAILEADAAAAQRARVFEYARGRQRDSADVEAHRALFASALDIG